MGLVAVEKIARTATQPLFRPEQQHRRTDIVLHAAGGRSKKDIGKETVSVGAHGYQVAALLLDPFDDLAGWLAVGEFGLGGDVSGLELGPHFFQISSIFSDFPA